MYNRYTPQPDGSYKRKTVPVPCPTPPAAIPDIHKQDPPEEKPPMPFCDPPRSRVSQKPKKQIHRPETSAGTFLKDLLPKNLDTGDLLVIILLLLMSADGNDDQSNALFTLAMYLFM